MNPDTIREYALDRHARVDELETVIEYLEDCPFTLGLELSQLRERLAVRREQLEAYRRRHEMNLAKAREAARSDPSEFEVSSYG